MPDFSIENGHDGSVCGLDEVGRGPLAGPVVAAAVILDPDAIPDGLNDSKKLNAERRDRLFEEIIACADYGVGIGTVERIDVETGIGEGSRIEVRGAIQAGDQVVVRGGERLQAGQAVVVQ